jgi:hypothetical protein
MHAAQFFSIQWVMCHGFCGNGGFRHALHLDRMRTRAFRIASTLLHSGDARHRKRYSGLRATKKLPAGAA